MRQPVFTAAAVLREKTLTDPVLFLGYCLKIGASKWCASLQASVSDAVVLYWNAGPGQPPRSCRHTVSGVQCVRWHSGLADQRAARGAQEELRAAARGRGGGGWEGAVTSKCVCVCAQLSWSVWLCNRCIIIRERPSGGRSLFGSVQPVDGDESSRCHWLDAAVHTLPRSTRAPASRVFCGFYSRRFLCDFQHGPLRCRLCMGPFFKHTGYITKRSVGFAAQYLLLMNRKHFQFPKSFK